MASNMAAGHDIFECQVCLEEMLTKQPRLLHCGHSFCSPCLQQVWQNNNIQCPTCRRDTPANQITDLALNFNLAKMKQFQQEVKETKVGLQVCDICSKKGFTIKAEFDCDDCDKKLCDGCYNHHTRLPAFQNHKVKKIVIGPTCMQHSLQVQYFCTKCSHGLCLECTFDSQHSDHAEEIENLETGVTFVKQNISTLLDDTTQAIKDVETAAEFGTTVKNIKNRIRQKVAEIHRQLEQEQDKIVKDLPDETFFENIEEMKKSLSDSQAKLGHLMESSGSEFLEELPGIHAKVQLVVTDAQKYRNINKNIIFSAAAVPGRLIGTLKENSVWNPKLMLNLDCRKFSIRKPSEIELCHNSFLVCDHGLSDVQEFSFDGTLLGNYNSAPRLGSTNAVKVHENVVYIGQEHGMTQISGNTISVLRPKIDGISCFEIIDSRFIAIAGYRTIVIYDKSNSSSKEVVNGLDNPNYMSYDRGNLAVTESDRGTVSIYNNTWEKVGRISGGHDFVPAGVTFLPSGNLLVADNKTSRIIEYKPKGEFVACVLDRRSGISYPDVLKYKNDKLLLIEEDMSRYDKNTAVKLFSLIYS